MRREDKLQNRGQHSRTFSRISAESDDLRKATISILPRHSSVLWLEVALIVLPAHLPTQSIGQDFKYWVGEIYARLVKLVSFMDSKSIATREKATDQTRTVGPL